MTLRITALGTCCLLALLPTACTGDDSGTAQTSPAPSETPSPTPVTTSTPPPDPKKIAADGASAAYRRWSAGIFKMQQSGGKDVSMLQASATGIQLDLDRSHASQVRRRKVRAVRDGTIVTVTVVRFGRPNAQGRITAVDLTSCVDVTLALAVDSSGKSVVAKHRPPRLIESAKMQMVDQAWKATLVTNRQAKTC